MITKASQRRPLRLATFTIEKLARWLTRPEPALAVDIFRICGGLILLAYFSIQLADARLLVVEQGLLSIADAHRILPRPLVSVLIPPVSEATLLILSVAGTCASAGLAVGFFPRGCAGVCFALTVALGRALGLVAHLDDYFATLLAFWLMLLPVGQVLTYRTLIPRRSWQALRVPGTSGKLLIIALSIHLLVPHLWWANAPSWQQSAAVSIAFAALPVTWCVGARPMAAGFAFLVQTAIVGATCAGLGHPIMSSVLLAAGVAVLIRNLLAARTAGDRPPTPTLGAAPVVGALSVVGFVVLALSTSLAWNETRTAASRMLFDLGVLPPNGLAPGCGVLEGQNRIQCGGNELHWRDPGPDCKPGFGADSLRRMLRTRGTITRDQKRPCEFLGKTGTCHEYGYEMPGSEPVVIIARLGGCESPTAQCNLEGRTKPDHFPPPCDQVFSGRP